MHRSKSPHELPQVNGSADVYGYVRDTASLAQEDAYVLLLNNRNKIVGHTLVSRGTSTSAVVNANDVLRPAVLAGVERVIMVHNHPSGDPAPSPQDVSLTRELAQAANTLHMTLLDHVIVGYGGYSSLRDMGVLR